MNRMGRLAAMGVALGWAVLAGCTEQAEELTEAEKKQVGAHILEKAPTPEHTLDASLEGKVELLGYSLSSDVWKEGEELTVTWYWKAVEPLDEGWRLFTHIADASGTDRINQDATGVIRGLYPPGRWEAGEYIEDVQKIALPYDWNSPRATFHVGIWNGPHRLQLTSGPSDGDNRVRAFSIRTVDQPEPAPKKGEVEPSPLPTLRARRTDGPIEVDGKLDEPVWKKTEATGQLVHTVRGEPAAPETTVRTAWNDDHLFVAFEVRDDFLKSEFEERDDHLWEQDAVEIMVDPDGDGRNYFEMQVSPRGVVFDTRYDSRRQPRPFGHVDWNAELETGVELRGELGDDEEDEGYTVEAAIPWKAFAAGSPPAPQPSAGDTWRMNFYVMDAREEGQRAAGWSPVLTNDFHVPKRFGVVRFAKADGSVPAREPSPGAARKKAGDGNEGEQADEGDTGGE